MPIITKEESLPQRPIVIVLYGEPGIGKTSLFNTSDGPLLLDFDRGVDRSIFRQDTLVINKWEDVQEEEKQGSFKNYQTVGIDTAKAALDDFLMAYVVRKDYKNAKNKLAAYGSLGDEFKVFVSNRRADQADLVIIAHAKDDRDGDIIRKIPDVTGQSYSLLLRIADQVGYMKTINNKRIIQFEPTDQTIGKNVARLKTIEIPDESDAAFPNFMGTIVRTVKSAISVQSDAQKEAIEKVDGFRKQIETCKDPEELTRILQIVNELPPSFKNSLRDTIGKRAKECKFTVDKKNGTYIAPVQKQESEPEPIAGNESEELPVLE